MSREIADFHLPTASQRARLKALRERRPDLLLVPYSWTASAVEAFLIQHDDELLIPFLPVPPLMKELLDISRAAQDAIRDACAIPPELLGVRDVSDDERVVYTSPARFDRDWACGWCNDRRPHVHQFKFIPEISKREIFAANVMNRPPDGLPLGGGMEHPPGALERFASKIVGRPVDVTIIDDPLARIDTSDIPEADEEWFATAELRVPPGYKR